MHPVVFLFDVDNTLLDNDRVTADLEQYLIKEVGPERETRYWAIFEELRNEHRDGIKASRRGKTSGSGALRRDPA